MNTTDGNRGIVPRQPTKRTSIRVPNTTDGNRWISKILPTVGCQQVGLEHPPTPVRGIWLGWASLCRPDFNNPPTAVGGIQLPLLIAPRAQCSLGLDEQHTDRIRRASSRSLRLTGGIMASVLISGFLKTIQRHFY